MAANDTKFLLFVMAACFIGLVAIFRFWMPHFADVRQQAAQEHALQQCATLAEAHGIPIDQCKESAR